MKNSNSLFLFLALIVIAIIVVIFLRRKLKHLVLPNVFVVTGAPKTGKSALSIFLARVRYLKNVFAWHVGKIIKYLIKHNLKDYPLKPMFYSNIPLGFMHNPLTKQIIFMEVKIPPKSVVLIDEASLFADSQLIKDKNINDKLTLFCKLFGHITYGGTLIFNTQCITDLHYAIKRVCGRYLYIYQTNKYPFFSLCKVREMVYSDDTSMVNDVSQDLELSMRTMFFFNWIYKKYDCFCYSVFVDDKMIQVNYDYKFDKKKLKADSIISFNPVFANLKGGKQHEDSQA